MDTQTILLVTTTRIETQAVFNVFERATKKNKETQQSGSSIYYLLGIVGSTNVILVQADIGGGSTSGNLLISQAIRDIRPNSVMNVGLAYGIDRKNQKLGDILISSNVSLYELQKTNRGNKAIPRSDRFTVSPQLLNIANSIVYDWNISSVHIGPMLSGDKLINNQAFRDELLSSTPTAIGGEMEGAGLYAAVNEAKVDCILVRSICDWADGTKNDDAQALAANNAALFVLAIIQRLNSLTIDLPLDAGASKKTSSQESKSPSPPESPVATESTPLDQPTEPKEVFSQYTFQDNALEKHAATDKPVQSVEQDKLGFGVYVTALHDFIVSQYTTTPLTISIDGPWGTGKSSLMFMLRNSLDPNEDLVHKFYDYWINFIPWWKWFVGYLWVSPARIFYRVAFKLCVRRIRQDSQLELFIGNGNPLFLSFLTDIAKGFSINPELLKQPEIVTSLPKRVYWWANIRANSEPLEPAHHRTVWLNAWKFDNQEEVWASLALATLEQIKQNHNIFWLMWFRIRLTFKRLAFIPALGVVFLQFALPLILGVIAFYYTLIIGSYETPLKAFIVATRGYGNYLIWAGGILSGLLTVNSVLKDPFQIPVNKILDRPNYKDKVTFLATFEKDFARIVDLSTSNGLGWKKSKLVIFVDDLDRCEPPKAADIIEAVNLFLDAEGCVFVVGMDSESVAKSIEVKYKDLFERIKAENAGVASLGRAFLEKIVQIPFTVPRASYDQIMSMVKDTFGGTISTDHGGSEPDGPNAVSNESEARIQEGAQSTQFLEAPEEKTASVPNSEKKEAEDPASFARKEVQEAIGLGTRLLSENPRQVKTFVNLFRLSIYIANAKGFFEEGRTGEKLRLIGLDRLAIWVTCSVRWPNLVRHLYTETQTDSLCGFLQDISKNITSEYKWTTGHKNVPTKIKERTDSIRKAEKSSQAHWCHLPWDWWLLESDFLEVVKRMQDLWSSPGEGEPNQLSILLNLSRPLSSPSQVETNVSNVQ